MEPAIEHRVRKSRRTITQIRRLLRLFEQGNITGLGFCKLHDIDKSTFYKWKSRYGSRGVEKKNNHRVLQKWPRAIFFVNAPQRNKPSNTSLCGITKLKMLV
jgi:hypothetical protein